MSARVLPSCALAYIVGAQPRIPLIRRRMVQNSQCDNCLIGCAVFLQYLSCICDLAACVSGSEELAACAHVVDCCADYVWCSVCACMIAQHKKQLDYRDTNPAVSQGWCPSCLLHPAASSRTHSSDHRPHRASRDQPTGHLCCRPWSTATRGPPGVSRSTVP